MLVGGTARTDLYRRFVQLAGGDSAQIVVVPTAKATVGEGGTVTARQQLLEAGAHVNDVTVLHTRDPAVADTDSFATPLDSATAVWFGGGRQWRLVKTYAGTQALEGFRSVLERGGVIGGSSAGATIQGSFLVRGDTASNRIMMGAYQEGFGFLPQSAVDQHVLARNRVYDLIAVIEAHPRLLGIGLDENTAAVIRGDTMRVVGESKVAIYDHHRWTRADGALPADEKFFFLEPGDRFDLRTRRDRAARSP
jgi:cyanophycinase